MTRTRKQVQDEAARARDTESTRMFLTSDGASEAKLIFWSGPNKRKHEEVSAVTDTGLESEGWSMPHRRRKIDDANVYDRDGRKAYHRKAKVPPWFGKPNHVSFRKGKSVWCFVWKEHTKHSQLEGASQDLAKRLNEFAKAPLSVENQLIFADENPEQTESRSASEAPLADEQSDHVRFTIFFRRLDPTTDSGEYLVLEEQFSILFDEFPRTSASLVATFEQKLLQVLPWASSGLAVMHVPNLSFEFYPVDGRGETSKSLLPRDVVYAVQSTIGEQYPAFEVVCAHHNKPVPYVQMKFEWEDVFHKERAEGKAGNRIALPNVKLRLSHIPEDLATLKSELMAHLTEHTEGPVTYKWEVNIANNSHLEIFWLEGKGAGEVETRFVAVNDLRELRSEPVGKGKSKNLLIRACGRRRP